MTKSEQKQLMALIGKASKKDMEIVKIAYNARQDSLAQEAKLNFSVGDMVSLIHNKFGGYAEGVVVKVNRSKAKVMIGVENYNVPFTMLTKVGA